MPRHTHFIGIGGIGMSALAELLLAHGEQVSGCDRTPSHITERLRSLGATVHLGHDPSHLQGVHRVVFTDAIHADNPELFAAQAQGLEVLRRSQLLGAMMAQVCGVAVTGTHGKTTVTAMIALILMAAGRDPSVLVGGEMPELGGNFRAGAGPLLVAEACEAYGSFLELRPRCAVITNMEAEHLDFYRDLADIAHTFMQFVRRLPADGLLVTCADRPELAPIAAAGPARRSTYGLTETADYRAHDLREGDPTRFAVTGPAGLLGEVSLPAPGQHMVVNATGALALCLELGVDFAVAARALAGFHGVGRRFQVLGEVDGITVMDDYAHHPTEIRATLAAARARCRGRLTVVFQPHLYSRTQQFMADFARAFADADRLLLVDIYPAREDPLPGVSSEALARAVRQASPGKEVAWVGPKEAAGPRLVSMLAPGDWAVTMGAGDVDTVGRAVLAALRARAPAPEGRS